MNINKASPAFPSETLRTPWTATFPEHFQPKTYDIGRLPAQDELNRALGKDQLFDKWGEKFPQIERSVHSRLQSLSLCDDTARDSLPDMQRAIHDTLSSTAECQTTLRSCSQIVWRYKNSADWVFLQGQHLGLDTRIELLEDVTRRLQDLLAIGDLMARNEVKEAPRPYGEAVLEARYWCDAARAELHKCLVLLEPWLRDNLEGLPNLKRKPTLKEKVLKLAKKSFRMTRSALPSR